MNTPSKTLAAITQPTPQELALSGTWTARGIGEFGAQAWQFDPLPWPKDSEMVIEASRIEALCTPLGRPLLMSRAFAEAATLSQDRLVSLGRHRLRGVREETELFGLA